MDKPLISVLVVCYNNQQYIYECLRSIFSQTYPNIEILIGDDCSENFDGQALIEWINKCRTPNISRIVVNRNEKNLGTVANLEQLQMRSAGEFLFNIAADDAMYDANVLDNLYARAMEVGDSAEFIVAETEMWDHELKKCIGHFMTKDSINRIENYTPMQLFATNAYNVILPASFLYRRSILVKVGKLSGQYRLVEDVPTHLRLLAQGVRPYYMSVSPSIKHRDGGISHGNSRQSKLTFLLYYNDLINIYANEVEPYMHLIPESDQKHLRKRFEDRYRAYYKIHVPAYYKSCEDDLDNAIKTLKGAEKAKKLPSTLANTVRDATELAKAFARREKIKQAAYALSRKKVVLCAVLLMFLCFITAGALNLSAAGFAGRLKMCMLFAGCLSAVFAAGASMVNILLRIRQRRH